MSPVGSQTRIYFSTLKHDPAVTPTHEHPDGIGRWERHGSNGVLFWGWALYCAAAYERPEDAERDSQEPEDTLPLLTPAEAENRYREVLGWALGIPEDAELPLFGDVLQQVRGVRNLREESAPPPFQIAVDAIQTLEKNWDTLTLAQQYNAREDLRASAKTLSPIDRSKLPSSGEW